MKSTPCFVRFAFSFSVSHSNLNRYILARYGTMSIYSCNITFWVARHLSLACRAVLSRHSFSEDGSLNEGGSLYRFNVLTTRSRTLSEFNGSLVAPKPRRMERLG